MKNENRLVLVGFIHGVLTGRLTRTLRSYLKYLVDVQLKSCKVAEVNVSPLP